MTPVKSCQSKHEEIPRQPGVVQVSVCARFQRAPQRTLPCGGHSCDHLVLFLPHMLIRQHLPDQGLEHFIRHLGLTIGGSKGSMRKLLWWRDCPAS